MGEWKRKKLVWLAWVTLSVRLVDAGAGIYEFVQGVGEVSRGKLILQAFKQPLVKLHCIVTGTVCGRGVVVDNVF